MHAMHAVKSQGSGHAPLSVVRNYQPALLVSSPAPIQRQLMGEESAAGISATTMFFEPGERHVPCRHFDRLSEWLDDRRWPVDA
jgi:hypothetical protein